MTVIDFKEAQRLVDIQARPEWDPRQGAFYVADWGYESPSAFRVVVGPEEWLKDGAETAQPTDPILYLVSKKTGEVEELTYLEAPDLLDSMKPVGTGHPET